MYLTRFTRALVVFVIFDFFMFFILEAIFWMQPFVHNLLLDWFNNPPASLGYEMHALVLKKLFINQGFYNLFFVIGGIAGLYQQKIKSVGYALILLVCFAAVGAGLVLAVTSNAYLLACLQAIPAAIAFLNIYPLFKHSTLHKD
ncbi:DUF1304 family protein [Pedobacter frigidisoli]|uniref:DUF1304 family protein n=1 Tax=Pedobacter frigidisoli TaxID=2530455 RepID=A0A4R0P7S1_9SPHI|nr:DUF1304 family protein [Pedobacter frigidisoli]TCD11582.1 DUF1304 family protein [Pedobacter frigidisoli]